MKKMKKLAAALLALSCIFAVGGLTACVGSGTNTPIQSEVQLDKLAITMKIGETQQISVLNLGGEKAEYDTSNASVATVDADGNVTAVGIGKADITVKVGEKTTVCKITVIKIAVSDVMFRYPEVNLPLGSEKELQAVISPLIATDKSVTFVSSNESIATIDSDGVVKGIAEGEATITVTTVDGGKTATCKVTVGKAVESITLNKTELTLIETKTAYIDWVITPTDAIIQDVVWTSSDESVAVVSVGEVFALKEGTATITATSVDGKKVATCEVTVEPYIYITSVEMEKQYANIPNGTELRLIANVLPTSATDSELNWVSSDTSVAVVDANGNVSTRGVGTATITATSKKDKTLADSVEISVIEGGFMFYNKYYTPEGTFSFTAYDVDGLVFNGVALEDSEYTYEENVVTVEKSVLQGKTATAENTLTFVSANSGNTDVSVKVLLADLTSFNAGQIGVEILGNLNNNATSVTANTSTGTIGIKIADTSKRAYVNLNEEYLKAMFANPTLNTLSFSVELKNIASASDTLGYPSIKSDTASESGIKMQAQYTKYEAKRSVGINRAAFNGLNTLDNLSNFGVWIEPSKLKAGAEIILHSVYVIAIDNADTGNRLYADAQLIAETGLPYLYPGLTNATIKQVKFGGSDVTSSATQDGDRAILSAALVNSSIRNGSGYDVTPNGWDRDRVYVYTKAMIDDNQYVNVDKVGDTYTYPLNLGEGDKIFRVTLNGKLITTFDAKSVTVNKADLKMGHNALEVNVEHTTKSSVYNTTIHTYYRSLCAVTQSQLNNAITFEDGKISPFVSIIGTASVVDSKVINEGVEASDYAVDYQSTTVANGRYYTDSTKDNAKIANMKVLSVSANAKVYVSTYWIKARVEALGYNTETFTSKLLWRVIRPVGGTGGGTSSTYGGVANGDLWEFVYGNTNDNGSTECVTLATGAQYAKMLEEGAANYLEIVFTRPKYIDDLGANITGQRYVNATGVDSVLSVKLI